MVSHFGVGGDLKCRQNSAVGWPLLIIREFARTDAKGRFESRRVPPGPVSVQAFLSCWMEESFRAGPSVPLDVSPGSRVDLDLGSAGATLGVSSGSTYWLLNPAGKIVAATSDVGELAKEIEGRLKEMPKDW